MTRISLDFGFFPDPLEISVGDVTIQSLPDRRQIANDVRGEQGIEKDWIFPPAQQSRDFISGSVRTKPYSARVFGLPKTHAIAHETADDKDHLTFHLWSLSFFSGLRLTSTEAGFLDATPLKPGTLNDFVLLRDSLGV
ncbi:MAG: hypothetical protein P1U65_02730 [Minwuia sp.]|nr:hypothetical protein [Minwuia sp.]